jgi:type IX secretion system substrate protein
MPNPAKDYVILEYQLEMPGDAEIRLLDIEGSLMQTIKVNEIHEQVIVNTSSWIPGIYIATLNTNGKKLQSVKFAIVN